MDRKDESGSNDAVRAPPDPKDRSSDGPLTLWLLGLIVVVAGSYWALEYQPYVLPNSDFFRIQEMARQFAAVQVPDDFKQMPLVPLLMLPIAAVAAVAQVDSDVYLHAVSVLNIALSMASLVLLYMLSRVFLRGALALVPVVLLLAVPQFTVSAHQPMLEPTIGFFTLATLLALAHRSRWVYALAGAAALTRYELAALLPVAFLVTTVRRPSRWLGNGIRTAIAAVPFVLWFGASVVLPSQGNPYFDDIVRASPVDVAVNMLTPLPGREFMLVFLAVGWSVGLLTAFKRDRTTTLGIVAFFGLYGLAHLLYGRPLERYSYTVLWVVPLLATIGFARLGAAIGEGVRRLPPWLVVGTTVAIAGLAAASWLRAARFAASRVPASAINSEAWYVGWATLWVVLIVAIVAIGAHALSRRQSLPQAMLAAACAAALVTTPLVLAAGNTARSMAGVYYDKAEMVIALEWLSLNTDDHDTVVMPRYHELRDGMPTITSDRVVSYASFDADSHEAFVSELDERDIEYVVFLHRPERPTDPSHPLYGRNMANYLGGKIYLMDPFRHGEHVEGFTMVATLPEPHPDIGRASHVYRRNHVQQDVEGTADD